MAKRTDSVINITNTLHRVPTLQVYSGEKGFAFVNPKLVSALEPEEVDIGERGETVKGTRVVTPQEIYFVPLTLVETADKLDIELLGQEQEANA